MTDSRMKPLANVPAGGVVPDVPERQIRPVLGRLVGSRTADRILKQAGAAGIARWPASEIAASAGVSLQVAERVVAARDLSAASTAAPTRCESALDVRKMVPWLERFETEVILAIALTTRMQVRAVVLIAKGGTSSATVHARDVFRPLVRLGASCFVIVHNHPSGDPTPSKEDVAMTNALAEAGQLLGITLVDHVVVAAGGMVSFVETALLPTARELKQSFTRSAGN